MKLRHIRPERIPFEWERMAGLLAQALAHDPNKTTLKDLYAKLTSGNAHCLEVTADGVHGVLVFEVFEEEDEIKAFTSYIAGKVELGPKAWVAAMRAMMAEFEHMLADAGCVENYIGGRDWSRIFPDYEPADGVPNRRKKGLSHV
jgi:hypothetical protein